MTFWFLCPCATLISWHYSLLSLAVSKEANWKLADNQEAGGVTEILWTWKLDRGYKGPESQASVSMKDNEEPKCSIVTLFYQKICSVLLLQWVLLKNLSELFTKYVRNSFQFLPPVFLVFASRHLMPWSVYLLFVCVNESHQFTENAVQKFYSHSSPAIYGETFI